MNESSIQIEASWKELLQHSFEKAYFPKIKDFILKEKERGKVIFPPGQLIFNAFDTTPVNKVKVVILGQDPYHGDGQAHGLSFSVPNGIKPPPSLVNIFKELQQDVSFQMPNHGNLTSWAQQGVLLLNAFLTVNRKEPASHQAAGWESFTDDVIQALSDKREHIVFLLWGKFAQSKAALIDKEKHLVLAAPHPSPFSAHTGFFGCQHFSKANNYLIKHGKEAINWQI